MRKIIPYCLTLILCSAIVYLMIKKNQTEEINRQLLAVSRDIIDENRGYGEFAAKREYETALNGSRLGGKVIDMKNRCVRFRDIFCKDKLCLVISNANCPACIQIELLNLENSKFLESGEIVLFINTSQVQFAKSISNDIKLNCEVYIADDKTFPVLSKTEFPCYFVCEKGSNRINSAFMPSKDSPEISISYLDGVYQKFFCPAD